MVFLRTLLPVHQKEGYVGDFTCMVRGIIIMLVTFFGMLVTFCMLRIGHQPLKIVTYIIVAHIIWATSVL